MSADWWLYEATDACAHYDGCECEEVWHGNLTYNLNPMLAAAGWTWPDGHVWCKERIDGAHAADLGEKVAYVVANLRGDPERFRAMNPPNGWGNYDDCLATMEAFMDAIEANPGGIVRTWL